MNTQANFERFKNALACYKAAVASGEPIFKRGASRFIRSVVHSAVAGAVGPRAFEGEMFTPPQSLQDLQKYGVFVPDAIEAIRQPLYDRLPYPTAGVAGQLRFFQAPQGQGNSTAIGGTGLVKTLDDTNMVAAGQLPMPQAFLATSIEIIIEGGSISTANAWSPVDIAFLTNASAAAVSAVPALAAVNDTHRIAIGGWLSFDVGSKPVLQQSRLDSFPPKSFVSPDAAIAQSGNLGYGGVALARAVGRPFYLNPPILLQANVNFVVTLNWNVAVATTTGLNARVMVRLDGILYRNAQ